MAPALPSSGVTRWKHANALGALVLILLHLGTLFIGGVHFSMSMANPGAFFQNDFGSFYVAAAVLNSPQPVLYDDPISRAVAASQAVTTRYSRYIYPPFFAVALRPLAALPFLQSVVAWLALNLAFLGVTLYHLLSLAHFRVSAKLFAATFLLTLAFPPVRLHLLSFGQCNLLILLLIVLCYLNSRPDSSPVAQACAGCLLGVAIGIKLFMAVLVPYYLFFDRPRVAVWAVIGFGLTLLVGVLGGGLTNTLFYFTDIFPKLALLEPPNLYWYNFSLGPTLERLFTPVTFDYQYFFMPTAITATLAPLPGSPALATVLSQLARILLGAATLVLLARAWLTQRHQRPPHDLDLGLAITATLLLIPLGWAATQVLILLPVALLFALPTPSPRAALTRNSVLLLASLCILADASWPLLYLALGPALPAAVLALGTLGLLLVWLLLARRI